MSQNKSKNNLGRLTLKTVKLIADQQENNTNARFEENTAKDFSPHHHEINELRFEDVMKTKTLKQIDLNFLELTINQIRELSSEELLKLLSGEGHKGAIRESTIHLISHELLSRQIKDASKPHWTITPAFFLLIATLILTAIPVAIITHDLISKNAKSSDNHANESEKIKTNSKP
jgi:hypothetical protein